ncbi:MAG TPA: ABC transporter permease subunit [Candidatus Limnocylindrales bacterium]
MTAAALAGPVIQPSLRSRLWGLGSVYGKSIRDSRRAIIAAAVLLGLVFIGITGAIASQFNTPESRAEMVALINSVPPILAGLAGPVVNVGTMGGYLQYKYGTFFPIILSLWSVLALSGTLASEMHRGSMEFLASTGLSRRKIALEKLSGHLTGLAIAFVVTLISITIAGASFAALPGDEISVTQAFGYSIWMVLMALAAGAVAFALAPFVGRGAAAGIAGFITIAGFVLNGYQAAVPALAPLANLTWFGWTSAHLPLAGQFDWPSVVFLAIFVVVMLAIGLYAFGRRDIGVTTAVPTPRLPRALVGLRGPTSRAIGHNLGAAIAWGVGIGIFGLLLAGASGSFTDTLNNSPDFSNLLKTIFPNVDFSGVGGFLQLLFIEIGIVLIGLAAATLASGWASDETSGRLEFLLATPLSRIRWAGNTAIGVLVDMALVVVLTAFGIAIGGATAGGDLLTPLTGTFVLFAYGAALIGIGVAVGGLWATRLAAPVVALVVLLTWLLQILGPLFNLPDFVQQLALTNHYGQPMVGVWDWGGIALSLGIAVVGVVIGAWGFKRRDLKS